MGSAYDETVFDFDLNFLNPAATNTVQELQAKNEKLRRSVIFLKKKILFSHSAVTRYKNARNYASILESNQVFSKEGCKQHLIEIKNFIEKVTKLENENRAAENREREKNETISDLQNKICALQSLETQLKLLLKEKNKTESTVVVEKKVSVRDRGKKDLLEKENEALRKENARIPKLEKEIENLRKEQIGISTPEKDCNCLKTELFEERTKIVNLEKEIETLRLDNARISRLQKEIVNLTKENSKLSKLEKELQILRRENTKMTRLGKENESLRKDNARVKDLEKEIETLRLKNAKIGFLERVNKTLRQENARIQNNNKEGLTNLTTLIEEKEQSKKNENRKTETHRNSDWSNHSGAEDDIFEDALLSPQPSDTVTAKNSLPADKNILRRESENDNSNEVVSVDTGRGSSLAYSDNEKGLHSPGYFSNDSPINGECIEKKGNDNNTPQSIIQIIVQDENDDISNSAQTTNNGDTDTEPPNQIHDQMDDHNVYQQKSISLENSNNMTPKKHMQGELEKEWLDLHKSMQNEGHIDAELENIFSTMKLNYHVLSPIPRTPIRVRDNVSTKKPSEPSEKIMRCMYLSNKTDQLLMKLKGYLHNCTAEYFCKFNPNLTHQNSKFLHRKVKGGKDFSAINNIDKLIMCFETILRTKQILTEDCNNSYLDVSDRVCDDDNLLMSNVTHSKPNTFQNKQGEDGSIRQMISPPICSPLPVVPDVQQKRLIQNNNTLVSANVSLPQTNKNVVQDNQKETTLSSVNTSMSPESIQNRNNAKQDNQTETQLVPVTISATPEPVQIHKDGLRSNQRRTRLFSNDSPISPESMPNCKDTMQNNQKAILSSDTIPVSPEPMQKQNSDKGSNQRRTRLFSNDSSMSPDTLPNCHDALQDNQKKGTTPISPRAEQKQNNEMPRNLRRTRLFSNDSSTSPDTMPNCRDILQDNQKTGTTLVSPKAEQKQNNEMQRSLRRTRLFSNDLSISPDKLPNCQDILQDNQNTGTILVSPKAEQKQNNERRRTRLFSNDSSMSPDTLPNCHDALQDNQKKGTTPISPRAEQKQNNEMRRGLRRTRLFSNDSSMSPDMMRNSQDTTSVSPKAVQNLNNALRSNQTRTRLVSNDLPVSPEPIPNRQDTMKDSQKKIRLSSDTRLHLPVSPETTQKHCEVLQENQGLLSIIIPMSPDSIQNKRKTRLSATTLPVSAESTQNLCNIVPEKQRKTRFSSTSLTSPGINHTDDLQNNQRKTRLSSISSPLSPPTQNRKNDFQNTQQKIRLSSITSSISPKPIQNLNHSVYEDSTTNNEPIKLSNTRCSQDSVEMNELSMKDSTVKKAKTKKITKLDKLRKNLAPKYKIRRETTPVKSLIKPKNVSPIKKQVTANVTSASLNDKDVYEKAVKIMAELNSQKSSKVSESSIKYSKEPLSPKPNNNLEIEMDTDDRISQNRKFVEVTDQCTVVLTKCPLLFTACETKTSPTQKTKDDNETTDDSTSRKRRRLSSNDSVVKCKRVLRSSTVQLRSSTEDNIEISDTNGESTTKTTRGLIAEEIKTTTTTCDPKPLMTNTQKVENTNKSDDHIKSYEDLDLFSEVQVEKASVPVNEIDSDPSSACQPKDSILCCMIEKYGVATVRPYAKKIPDSTVKLICDKIEQEIAAISELPLNETKNAMNIFVADLRKLNYKHFITGLIKYLTKPERKHELFGKVSSPAAPAMTKAEQILLYVITHLKTHWPSVDIVDAVLSNIEYALFKLNRTPDFEVIESTSHFYALLCRYFGAKSRLRLFILDAMYCIQFKSVPLIKQCLEVWMHIIPLAHMGIAKTPLVTCLVYLLHFYKCDDKFNRVQEIRNILSRRYFYQITDWNETKILEMFRNSIKDLKDIPIEKKMLRLALIILAKRHGPRWCQNNIIKNLLQPMIEKENVPNSVKVFCVSMIGPLMKPYPVDMKVHCEIAINQLTDILNNNPSPQMEEAAIMSMMFINRHNQYSMNQTLLTRKMKPMSPELEKTLCDYVKTKPLKIWKKTLAKIAR
uniref:Uncharacterized protein n=1 Tax=Heliothis virescens TaxID=7102 RepID=A0A2A4ITD6_HELVI